MKNDGVIIEPYARGEGHSSSIAVTPAGVRLPPIPARYVILSNWNVQNDAAFTKKAVPGVAPEDANDEVYWGFDGVYAHQLFASQTTGLIPCSDLSQICLRSLPADAVIQIWYSWIL